MKLPQAGAKNEERKTGAEMGPVVKVLDVIGLNSHPYYGRIDRKKFNSADKALSEQSRIRQYWNARGYNIPVWITDTGYPTARNANMGAVPIAAGLEAFASQMETASRQNDLPVYLFESLEASLGTLHGGRLLFWTHDMQACTQANHGGLSLEWALLHLVHRGWLQYSIHAEFAVFNAPGPRVLCRFAV
jgi:hypothetical protein